jgi:hypothetical protein
MWRQLEELGGSCDVAARLLGPEHQKRRNAYGEVENCSCEKRDPGSWGQEQFRNSEEGERSPLEAATKQRLFMESPLDTGSILHNILHATFVSACITVRLMQICEVNL